jgi:CBS domain-containing protein
MTPADTADAAMSVAAFVERRLYPLHHHLFPVVSGGRLVGAVGLKEVSATPRDAWDSTPVGDIARVVDAAFLAPPDESARDALARMARGGERTLVVTDGAQVLGVVGAQDLLDHLQMRVLLEG